MEERRVPKPGELYQHFKGNLYQILTVANHTETGEELVIYQALYGDYKFYARPISMFMSKVDTEKYPDVSSIYRFELFKPEADIKKDTKVNLCEPDRNRTINLTGEEQKDLDTKESDQLLANDQLNDNFGDNQKDIGQINSILMEFLDADTFRERLDIVLGNKKALTDKLINNMAMSMDCTVSEGDIEERISSLVYCIQTRIRFEDRRLR